MMSAFNQTRNTVIASQVEKADTALLRMKGLLGKKEMQKDYGLWIPSSGSMIHTFFMHFPIDVIFLSKTNQVVKLIPNMVPSRLSPWVCSAKSVLELSAGTIEKNGTQVGDQVVFQS